MTVTEGQQNGDADGAGTLDDGLQVFLHQAQAGVRAAAAAGGAATGGDPHVSSAFVLGWQMAQLYQPPGSGPLTVVADGGLPKLGHLGEDLLVEVLLKQIEAAIARLRSAVAESQLSLPVPSEIRETIAAQRQDPQWERTIRRFHVQLLSTLTAADFRLGKAYSLGRDLADACRNPTDLASLQGEFTPARVAKLRSWLDDLASALPPHSAKSVSESLGCWAEALDPGAPTEHQAEMVTYVHRQGQLWRALLSGEKCGTDMLVVGNYMDAADALLDRSRNLIIQSVRRFPLMMLAIVVLFAGGVALMLLTQTSASIVAGAAGILASAGLTWKGVGTALGAITGQVEQHLWAAEIDHAVAEAVTLLPGNDRERGHRRAIAQAIEDGRAHETPAQGDPLAGDTTPVNVGLPPRSESSELFPVFSAPAPSSPPSESD